ncbi:MAG TPA: DUF3105 domain-containing protein [Actinomycetota bacterium]|nr:DUF3105 domain-containing protein [Actinomycetota bacterium]
MARSRRGGEVGERPRTKAERREQARRERERLRREMARQRRNRRIGAAVLLLAAAGLAAFLLTRPREELPSVESLLAQGDAQAAAGCSEVRTVPPFDPPQLDQAHIGDAVPTMPPLSRYPSVPPASGPHAPSTLPAGIYDQPPPIDQVLHSLEHGAVVIWYDPSAPAAAVERVASFFDGEQGDHTIVAPYDYPAEGSAGRLPAGTEMALVAWHRLQTCREVSLPVAARFASAYRVPTLGGRPYRGEAPEPGFPI